MQDLPDTLCYLNGEVLPLNQAKVSVLDRGFIFGDGIYEVVPVYGRKLFRFDEHMARLERSLAKLRISQPAEPQRMACSRCGRLSTRWPNADGAQRPAGLHPGDARRGARATTSCRAASTPTVFMMANPMKPPTAEQRHHGVACVTARDFRWERGDIKSISLLGNVLARQISADQRRGRDDHVPRRLAHRSGGVATCGWSTKARCSARRRASMCSKASATSCCASCARRTASPSTCGRSPRPRCTARRRGAAQLGHQGGAAGDAARRRAGRPRRPARQARAGVCTAVRGLPARQKRAVDLARRLAERADRITMPAAEPSLIEYPSAFPIKVMGAQRRRLRCGDDADRAAASTRSFDAATIELRPSTRPQVPRPDAHRDRDQPRAARRAVPHAVDASDGQGGALRRGG